MMLLTLTMEMGSDENEVNEAACTAVLSHSCSSFGGFCKRCLMNLAAVDFSLLYVEMYRCQISCLLHDDFRTAELDRLISELWLYGF
jgi:hypothetical protein